MTEPDPDEQPEHVEDGPEDGPENGPHEDHDEGGLDLARAVARGLAGRTGRRRTTSTRRNLPDDRRVGPSRYSGAHPDERDPQTLDTTIDRLVAQAGWSGDLRVHGVFARWGAIVGRDVADHCTPESYADGRLVVRTDTTAWATQLTLLASTLVRRLNEELGEQTVTVIDVQPPRGPTWKKGRLRVKGRGPRDTYG